MNLPRLFSRRVPWSRRTFRRPLRLRFDRLEDRLAPTVTPLTLTDPSFWGNSGSGRSLRPSMSGDGQRVVFESAAPNLVPNDTNGQTDVFLYDRGTGRVSLLSIATDGVHSSERSGIRPRISADGRYVVFISDSADLVASPPVNNFFGDQKDVYVRDLLTGRTTMVSTFFDNSRDSESDSRNASVVTTADGGALIAWETNSANMVPGDTNGVSDVFVRKLNPDGTLAPTQRASVGAGGVQGNLNSSNATLSGNGRFVVFQSNADTLVAIDDNTAPDVFVRDLQANTTELITVDTTGLHSANSGGSTVLSTQAISADGRFVVFDGASSNLVTQNLFGNRNAFVRDRQAGVTRLLSPNRAGTGGASAANVTITPDGRFAAFLSSANDLASDVTDTNSQQDVFRAEISPTAITIRMVSANATGTNGGNGHSGTGQYDFDFSPGFPQLSDNGRFVAFASQAGDLVAGITDANQGQSNEVFRRDVFVRDMQANVTRAVSTIPGGAATGNSGSYTPQLSADGRFVAFESDASNLLPEDANRTQDIFLRDTQAGTTELATPHSPLLPDELLSTLGIESLQDVTPDGRYVAFVSHARDLSGTPTDGEFNVYVRDRQTGAIEPISVQPNGAMVSRSQGPVRISADGRFVAFTSRNSALDTSATYQANWPGGIFVRDRVVGVTRLVSRNTTTNQGPNNATGLELAFSPDGRYVAFTSQATNLVNGIAVPTDQINLYLHDRQTATTLMVNVNIAGTAPGNTAGINNHEAFLPRFSADSRTLVFVMRSSDLIAGITDTNNGNDVFAYDPATGATRLVSVSMTPNTTGNAVSGQNGGAQVSANGRYVVFSSNATNLTPLPLGGFAAEQVFRRDLAAGTTDLVSVNAAGTAASGGGGIFPFVSADGRKVLFTSRGTDLTALSNSNNRLQAYVRDYSGPTPVTTLVSVNAAGTAPGNDETRLDFSPNPFSADGRYVAFLSYATDLVSGFVDGNASRGDLYLRDLLTGRTVLASDNRSGTATANQGVATGQFGHGGTYLLAANTPTVVFDTPSTDQTLHFQGGSQIYAYTLRGASSIAGTVFNDANGNGAQTNPTTGPGAALQFDGRDDWLTVPHSAALDPTAEATLAAWVRFDRLPSVANRNMTIIAKSGNLFTGRDLNLGAAFDNKFRFTVDNQSVSSTTVIQPGQWYQVTATYKANDRIAIYVNGALDGTTLTPNFTRQLSGSNPLTVGDGAVSSSRQLAGTVDEVQLWSRALTAAEIQTGHNRSLAGNETGLVLYLPFHEWTGITTRDATGNGRNGQLGDIFANRQPRRVSSTAPIIGLTNENVAPEFGIPFWTVFLDANGNRRLDPGEESVVSDEMGGYRFTGLPAGNYSVAAVIDGGFVPTSPAFPRTYAVTLATDTSAVTGRDFGARPAQVDLDVASVTAPAAAQPGQAVPVSWVAHNVGSAAITAPWQDAVYLSADRTLDASDTLLATVPHTGTLAASSLYTGTATVTLPAVLPGSYFVIVNVDRRFQVPNETNRANNIAASPTPTILSVPSLTLGTPTASQFSAAAQSQYFQVTAGQDRTLTFTLDSAATGGATELYVARNRMPSTSDFDLVAVAPAPDQTLVIPTTGPGTYYVLARGVEGAAATSNFTITAAIANFGLSGIDPTSAGNTGRVTIAVRGTRLTPATQVQLIMGGANALSPVATDFRDSSLLYATYDLTGRPVGAYDVRAVDGTSTATLAGAFTVTVGVTNAIQVRLIVPEGVRRQGRQSSAIVEYTNTGNTDAVAPLMELTATNAKLRLEGQSDLSGDFTLSRMQFLGIAPDGPAGVLRPGQTGRVRIFFLPPGGEEGVTINFNVTILRSQANAAMDWAGLKPTLRPSYIPVDAWDAIYANYVAAAGPTFAGYNALLAADATYLSQVGVRTPDTLRLFKFALDKADAVFTANRLASVVDADLSAPGGGLRFVRQYAQAIHGRYTLGAFGRGWTHNWEIKATTLPNGDVSVSAGTGGRHFFKRADGSYHGSDGDFAILTLSGGAYRLTEPNGDVTAFRPDGRLDFTQDADGNRVTAAYDAAGRLTGLTHNSSAAITLTYNAQSRVSQLTDSAGRTVTFAYDAAGEHLVSYTDQYGAHTYTYVTGQGAAREHALASVNYSDDTHITYTYDAQGRLTNEARDAGAEPIAYTYLPGGGFTVRDGANGTTTVLHDEHGQIARAIDPLGRLTEYAYDHEDNLVGVTRPQGVSLAYEYDDQGNLVRATDPLGRETEYTYDARGNLLSYTDAMGRTTRHTYDAGNNRLSATAPDGSTAMFAYDARGNLTAETNRRGRVISYTYNANAEITRRQFADGTSVNYTYDARSNLKTATDASGTITLDYDAKDALTKVTYPDGKFLQFLYNVVAQRTRSVDQDGVTVNYAYDDLGRLERLTDGAGALIVRYSYDAAGRLAREDKGNGTATTYEYDAAGQLTRIRNLAPGGAVNSSFTYTYDALGRRTSVISTEGTTTYGYDALGQLSSVDLPGGRTIRYEYDAAGNRTRVVDSQLGTTDYVVNDLNQVASAGATSFTYDADGNRTGKTDAAGVTTYTYNDENRLVAVSGPGLSATYGYNALANRDRATVNGTTTRYLLDPEGPDDVAAEYVGGSLVARYTYGLGLVSRVAASGAPAYYDFDATGNTAGLTNAAGTYVNRYSTLPFGETTTISAGVANPFTFVGRFGVMNDGSGQFDMRFRNYDPLTGQFASDDPIGLFGGDTNLRRYVTNDPVSRVDPFGLCEPDKGGGDPCAGAGWFYALCKWFFTPVPEPAAPPPNYFPNNPFTPPQPKGDPPNAPPGGGGGGGFGGPSCNGPPPGTPPTGGDNAGSGGSRVIMAQDPNDITGPAGFGLQRFVALDQAMPYTIRFENVATATAPAQEVFVTHTLDSDLDPAAFELGDFGFGSLTVDVPDGLQSYQTRLSTSNPNGSPLFVDVTAGLNRQTGMVSWTFRSIDPATGQLPEDAFAGFLPPNNATRRGEGFVEFTAHPKAGSATGAGIDEQASIVFDTNNPIATNVFTNTVDAGLPTSSVQPLPATTTTASFLVRWAGTDDTGGSGVGAYDVFVSDNGGPFTVWQTNTPNTSAVFSAQSGHTYAFYSVAIDNVGYRQISPTSGQASTVVNVLPPLVQGVIVNNGSAQRSMVRSISVTFNQVVTLGTGAFVLQAAGGASVGLNQAVSVVNGQTVVVLTFTGSGIVGGSLADGRYTLRVVSDQVRDSLGNTLDGDANGQAGGDYTFGDAQGLFRYYGDVTGDRRVDIADFGFFSLAYLTPANYNSALDFNNDGRIDIADFGQFSVRYFTTLP